MYKYAIIGFGGLGKLQLGNLLELEAERGDMKLCALCGADPNSFKSNVKINIGNIDISNVDFSECAFYQDYRELIDKEKPDFIISTLPTYLHEEVAIYALERGVHVFSEKPMALTLESCDRMIEAGKKGGKLMIGHALRFDPIYIKIKEYIDNETFGKPYRAEFSRYSATPTWTWNNWILDPEKSGGAAIDLHVHDVDLVNWLFGTPDCLRSVSTSKKTKRESMFTQYFYEDLFVTTSADWSMCASFPFEARTIINFERATVTVLDGKLVVHRDGEPIVPILSGVSCYMNEMRSFVEWVIDGKPCELISVESVRESMELAFSEIESAEKDLPIYYEED